LNNQTQYANSTGQESQKGSRIHVSGTRYLTIKAVIHARIYV